MEFSEQMLKRRMAALLPARSVQFRRSENGLGHNAPGHSEMVDVSDLPAIAEDERFLQEAYRRILDRECDISGFVNYTELLKRHVSRRVILLQLINSEEGRRRGISFTGVQAVERSGHHRSNLFSIRKLVGRLGALMRDVIRRIVFTRFDSIDHKLEFLLREVTSKAEVLTAKTNESFVTLSQKLDNYVATLSEENRRNREELAVQSSRTRELHRAVDLARELLASVELRTSALSQDLASQTSRLDQSISLLQAEVQATEQRRALDRIRPTIISAGTEILATEVAGLIVGVPGNEWRMAAHHAFRGVMEPGLTEYFCGLIKPGTVVVDVGANVGIYTLLAAKLLQGKGKVHSFEPAPRTYQILRDNVQVNGFLELGIIHLHQLAVTDRSGKARLSIFQRDSGHNTLFSDEKADSEIEVSTTSLDEILAAEEQVDIVKIDAEGAEPLILRGMRHVIERNPNIRIVLEFAPVHLKRAGCGPLELLDEIASLGFAIRRIDDVNGDLLNVTSEELIAAFSVNLQLELPHE
jgi:FkbM family methyltransferase